MELGEASDMTLEAIGDMVRQSEIDFGTLRTNICMVLRRQSQVCVSELLLEFGAPQGLGSVIGYISLGTQHGEVSTEVDRIFWGDPADLRRADIQKIYFMKERYAELLAG
jgi:hypothetical protein